MSAQDDHQMEGVENVADKGKGKAPEQPVEETEEDSSDESGMEQEVEAEPEEDNMEEIDTNNIVGSRTRGKTIDYAKAAAELPEDDDDDEDDDFEAGDDAMEE